MANRYIDTFDHYAQADVLRKWTQTATGIAANPPIVAGRNGNGMQLTGFGISLTLGAEKATWIAGLAYKCTAFANAIIAAYGSQGVGCDLHHVGDGRVELGMMNRNSTPSTFVMALNSFYYFELKVVSSYSGGQLTVTATARANGQQILTDSNTVTNSQTGFNRFEFDGPGGGNNAVIDDLYINDGDGTANNDFMGDVTGIAIFPDANGANSAWTRSSGAADWSLLDEAAPNDDTDYISSATAGQITTTSFQPVTLTGTFKAVQFSLCARKDEGLTRILKHVFRHSTGAQDTSTETSAIGNGYQYWRKNYDVNPVTAAAWTATDINAGEFGPRMDS